MLYLVFKIGADRYAIEAGRIVEVLPLVAIARLPQAPRGVAGIFDYRGDPTAALDLSLLTLGVPAKRRLSTRIILANVADVGYGATAGSQRVGLVAEGATETIRRERADFEPYGMSFDAAPYLGPVTRDARGLIQRIDVGLLLPSVVHGAFFENVAG